MLLLPPPFGHFPIQPTHLIIPWAEGVCQKLKVLPSLASVGAVEAFTNTWWNLEKAAQPHLKGLIISQSPLSYVESPFTLAFFKDKGYCKYLQLIQILSLTMALRCLQPSLQNQSEKPRYIRLVYEGEGKCVSNTS